MGTQLPNAGSAGRIARSRQVNGFVLTETCYDPGFRAPRHSHEPGYLFAVLDGSYTELLGSTTREYPPFALAYRPPGLVHTHSSSRGGRCFNIHPLPQARLDECGQFLRSPFDAHGALLPWLVIRLYHEFARPVDASALAIEGLALEILAESTRPSPHLPARQPPGWLEQAREFLHDRFRDRFTVAEVARSVGANPAYLCRVFRERYRCTIGEYVRRLRVELACRRLCTTDASLAEIALDAGFVDQSHFTKIFKRLTGMTPARFRDASRGR
jgi:AraC family transcriptional regulator